MKLLLVIGLGLLLNLHSVVQLVQVGWFILEQDRIAAEQCVQKDEPVNCCRGKCVLAEVVNKSEPQENRDARLVVTETSELVYCAAALSPLIKYSEGPSLLIPFRESICLHLRAAEIFHPPKG